MKVLQFAFDGHKDNLHLPHLHEFNDVIYTGTHDNDTTFGWCLNENNYNKDFFEEYTGIKVESSEQCVWSMIRLALSSVSFLCILPLQDLLMLDTSARMNTPGKIGGNWDWRFDWEHIDPDLIDKCSDLMKLYQR
jgi:4-alpha-glucanotransferase